MPNENETPDPVEPASEPAAVVDPVEPNQDGVVTDDAPSDIQPKAEGDKSEAKGSDTDDKESGSVPEKYDAFKMPEGMELDEGFFNKATDVFKEIGLTQEQGQKLADLVAENKQSDFKGQQEAFAKLKEDWVTETKNDKEIGGDKFDESIADANLALTKIGSPELIDVLTKYGLGNHPEMVRVFSKVGALIKEDSPDTGGRAVVGSKDRVDVLYPSETK